MYVENRREWTDENRRDIEDANDRRDPDDEMDDRPDELIWSQDLKLRALT
jgi:hypothetical protein